MGKLPERRHGSSGDSTFPCGVFPANLQKIHHAAIPSSEPTNAENKSSDVTLRSPSPKLMPSSENRKPPAMAASIPTPMFVHLPTPSLLNAERRFPAAEILREKASVSALWIHVPSRRFNKKARSSPEIFESPIFRTAVLINSMYAHTDLLGEGLKQFSDGTTIPILHGTVANRSPDRPRLPSPL